jgi:hypothetical protein
VNPFDDFIEADAQPVTPEAPKDPFQDFIPADTVTPSLKQSLAVVDAVGVTPDQAAEARALSKEIGVPAGAIEPNLDAVRKQVEQKRVVEKVKNDPALARFMSDPNFAKIVDKDDVDGLLNISDAFKMGIAQPINSFGDTLEVLGYEGAGKSLQNVKMTDGYKSASNAFINAPEGEFSVFGFAPQYIPRATAEQSGQILGSIATRVLGGAAGGAVGMAAGPAGGVAGTAVGAFAGPMIFEAAQIVGQVAKDRAKANGYEKPTREDMAAAWLTAGTSGALNAVGAKFLPGGEKAVQGFTKAVVRAFFGEASTEAAQSVVQQAGSTGGTEKGLAIDPRQAIGEGLLGGTAGGAMSAATEGVKLNAGVMGRASKIIDVQKDAAETQAQSENFTKIVDAAAQSKVLARDPEAFRQFVAGIKEQSDVDSVYIPAEKLAEYFQSSDITPEQLGMTQAELDSAIATDGDIAIPLENYLTDIAPQHHAKLSDYIRLTETSLTPEEARIRAESVEEIATEEQARIMQDMESERLSREPFERVKSDLMTQLKAAGFTEDVAQQYAVTNAALYQRAADRLGGDAFERYQSDAPRIVRDLQARELGKRITSLEMTLADAKEYFKRKDANANRTVGQKVADMFGAKKEKKAKAHPRPVLGYLESIGGIDPQGWFAKELKAADITPKNTPRIFKAGGKGSLDTIPASEFDGYFAEFDINAEQDGNGYVSQQFLMDLIRREAAGDYLRNPEQRAKEQQEGVYEELNNVLGRADLDIDSPIEDIRAALGAYQKDIGEFEASKRKDQNVFDEELYQTDGTLKTESEAFKKWFGDSKVVDADGKPLVVYHGTDADFNAFDVNKGELGAHFGTAEQANDREGSQTYPVYLSLQNPYDVFSDLGDWSDMDMLREYLSEVNEGPFTNEEFAKFNSPEDVRNGLIEKGYDGITYENSFEAKGRSYIAFRPEQIKSVFNRGTFDANDPRILYQSVDQPNGGFRSALLDAATALKQEKGSGDQMLGILKNTAGVKEEEIAWTGLDEFLKGKKSVMKAEIVAYLDENQVRVEEVTLSEEAVDKKINTNSKYAIPEVLRIIRADQGYADDALDLTLSNDGDAYRALMKKFPELQDDEDWSTTVLNDVVRGETATIAGVPKFSQYTLPGGENYREVLLTLPPAPLTEEEARKILNAKPDAKLSAADIEYASKKNADQYKSSHFDQPNILAHVRLNDRTDADGKKVLFVEEIQSDWHQAGRKKGYKTDFNNQRSDMVDSLTEKYNVKTLPEALAKATPEEVKAFDDITEKAINEIDDPKRRDNVPDAPLKKTWHEMAFRRITQMAAEGGYDRVAWTTGEQQNDRFDLSKQVDSVAVDAGKDGTYDLTIGLLDGGTQNQRNVPEDKLEDYVGKDLAKKLVDAQKQYSDANKAYRDKLKETDVSEEELDALRAKRDAVQTEFSGLDLKVGGEGMKGFYDKIIPAYAAKFGKKYGAKIGTTNIRGTELPFVVEDDNGNKLKEFATRKEAEDYMRSGYGTTLVSNASEKHQVYMVEDVHSLDITPEMRESVLRGVSLFQENRGSYTPSENLIKIFESANLSTFLHESGHMWLERMKGWSAEAEARLERAGDLDAEQVRKLQEVVDDYAKILAHIGNDGTTDLTRDQHEEFARTVEAYLMTGKAPSLELQPAFDRFKAWLLRIYESIKTLNVNLNPEITGVLDRMLATEEQIAEAERIAQYEYLDIPDATPEERMRLNRLQEAATGEAERTLLTKAMEPVRRQREKWWKDEFRALADTVRAEIEARPEWRALRLAQGDENIDPVKMDLKALEDQFGSGIRSLLPRGVTTTKGGVNPDEMAEQVGLLNAQELVEIMGGIKGQSINKLVRDETNRRMNEKYGDVLNDGSIEAEAADAVRNGKQADKLAYELKTLRRLGAEKEARNVAERRVMREGAFDPQAYQSEAAVAETGADRLIAQETARVARFARSYDRAGRAELERAMSDISPKSIRAAARKVIGQMKNKDLTKTAQYARAELKSADLARKAIAKRDYEQAAFYKYRQLLNHYLYIEAKAAQKELDVATKYLGDLAGKKMIPAMDQEYLDQIHGLLEQYDFKRASQVEVARRRSFAEWMAEQEAMGRDIVAPQELIDRAEKTHYSQVTLNELRGLKDTVKQIDGLGRMKQKLLDGQKEREYQEVVTEAVESIYDNNKRIAKMVNQNPTFKDNFFRGMRSLDASLLKMEQVFDWLDGGKQGVFSRVFKRFSDAQARSNDMTVQYNKQLGEILDTLDKKRMQESVVIRGYVNKDGVEVVWKRADLIAVVLNLGNQQNLDRLMERNGNNLTEANIKEIISKLNKTELEAANKIWELVDTLWPEIEAMEKRVNKVAPAKVEATPFEVMTADGETVQMRGGYYPIIYDPLRSTKASQHAEQDASKRYFEGNYIKASTIKNHTKERMENVGRPIQLKLDLVSRHLGQVIHDLTHREAIIETDRLLADKRIVEAVNNVMGQEYSKTFRGWLHSIAGDRSIDPNSLEIWAKAASAFRTNMSVMAMGFRFTTMISQISGFSAGAEMIGSKWVGVGMKEFYKNPANISQVLEGVREKSGEMRHRHNNIDRDLRDGIRKLERDSTISDIQRLAFQGISIIDAGVSVPLWIGAYQKGLSEKMSDGDAVAYADKVVRLSQSAAGAKDLSQIQRGKGNEFIKLFTMFYSYFNAMYARQRDMGRSAKNGAPFNELFMRSLYLMVIPAIGTQLLTGRGPEDDEDPFTWAMLNLLTYPFASIPLVRDIMSAFESGYGYNVTPVARGGDSILKLGKNIGKLATGEDVDLQRVTGQVLDVVGFTTGLPTGQVKTTGNYIWDVIDGDQRPDGVLEFMRGATLGPKKD